MKIINYKATFISPLAPPNAAFESPADAKSASFIDTNADIMEQKLATRGNCCARMKDWSKLPTDVHFEIAKRITFSPFLHKLALSCKEWHYCLIQNQSLFYHPAPMILLPYDWENESCTFFELDTSNTYTLPIDLDDTWICGSSNGWLLTADKNLDLTLFNPLSFAEIELPIPDQATLTRVKKHVERSSEQKVVAAISGYLRRAVISESPSLESNCLIAAIFSDSDKIAICRLGNKTWSIVKASYMNYSWDRKKEKRDYFVEVAIYKKKIYAVRERGPVALIDYQRPDHLTITNIPEPSEFRVCCIRNKYLVESAGDLLFIQRYGTEERKAGGTFSFDVHKLEDDKQTWTRVGDLKDRVILLGPGGPLSVSTVDVPWFRPNCIYFLDDFYIGDFPQDAMWWFGPGYQCENVIFSLENNSIEKFDLGQHILGFWPTPAMWYQRKP